MAVAAVEVDSLTKVYADVFRRRTLALDSVSLRVEPGTIFGLLGRNGAGKTTLVKLLLSLIRPTAGSGRVLGHAPGSAAVRRRIGYLPEQLRLPEYLRAPSFLRYMGRLNGVDPAALTRRIPEVLDLVGLDGVSKPIGAYSKGMQQRLGLAQSLLNDPDVLFLDEPTEGLDPIGRKQVRDLLAVLRAGGKTIFLNSHLLSEIELLCDHVVILRDGKVAGEGAPTDFARATGEYRIRVAEVTEAVRAAVQAVAPDARFEDCTIYAAPAGRAGLNQLIDRLRSLPVEIETIEQVRSTLEESFIRVAAGDTV